MNLGFIMEPGLDQSVWHRLPRNHCSIAGRGKIFSCSPQVDVLAQLFNPYPTAFPYGNGMVLHFYQQQESSTTKTVHKVINKGLKDYV